MPSHYSDVPEGFAVVKEEPQTFSDVPSGFSVAKPSWQDRTRESMRRLSRVGGLGTRSIARAAGGLADSAVGGLRALAGNPIAPLTQGSRITGAIERGGDRLGVPRPESTAEKVLSFTTEMAAGTVMGAPLAKVLSAAPRAPRDINTAPGARTLAEAGVRLDRSQRTGSPFLERVRSGVTDHPGTAGRMAKFTEQQLRDYTKAILSRIGSSADEATPSVMLEAKNRIGGVFRAVANKSPAVFDDVLQDEIATIMQNATRVVPDKMGALSANVDDILNAVDDAGRISGDVFGRVRGTLGALSRRPEIGPYARAIEDSLLEALKRSSPDDAQALNTAINQWRSMRIIEGAIDKGVEKFISPMRLSNAVATARNRAMSVYGQGGDQQLVRLAEAGRSVLPESLPQSGTNPRGLVNAPIRATATYPLYRAAQSRLLSQPNTLARPPLPLPYAVAPGSAAQNYLYPQPMRNALFPYSESERR